MEGRTFSLVDQENVTSGAECNDNQERPELDLLVALVTPRGRRGRGRWWGVVALETGAIRPLLRDRLVILMRKGRKRPRTRGQRSGLG